MLQAFSSARPFLLSSVNALSDSPVSEIIWQIIRNTVLLIYSLPNAGLSKTALDGS